MSAEINSIEESVCRYNIKYIQGSGGEGYVFGEEGCAVWAWAEGGEKRGAADAAEAQANDGF